jgi:exosome complex component RRP4
MKDLHLPLNQTQRVRCEKALHELQVLTPTTVLAAAVTIADTIPVNHEDSILRLPTLSCPILSLFLHLI